MYYFLFVSYHDSVVLKGEKGAQGIVRAGIPGNNGTKGILKHITECWLV